MITWVDKTINDGILRIWAEQRFYLIYPIAAVCLFVCGLLYGIKETLFEEDTASTVRQGMVYGVLWFLVMSVGVMIFSCVWHASRMCKCDCPNLSENNILALYFLVSLVFLLIFAIRYGFDDVYSFEGYAVLSFTICFFVVLCAILYLYR